MGYSSQHILLDNGGSLEHLWNTYQKKLNKTVREQIKWWRRVIEEKTP